MPIRNAVDFGKLIKETRKAGKVTQKDLAAACGTGIRFIRELEKLRIRESVISGADVGYPNKWSATF